MNKLTYHIINTHADKGVRVVVYDPKEYWVTERTVDSKDFPTVTSALAWVSTTYPGIEENNSA